jgi:Zn-dependent protease/CBS domain-containing protein
MNKQGVSLGRILGIPIRLDYSWFFIFILLTWSLATVFFPAEFSDWPTVLYWTVGTATALIMFVSVLLHELGHSVVAMRYKIAVRRITLFIFGGMAEINSEPPTAKADFWIALAGPAASFALAILFTLMQPVTHAAQPMLALVKYLAYVNGALALFNMIPGFPLDGGRILRSVLWGITHSFRRATLIAANVGRAIAFLFILAGAWQFLTGNWTSGLWVAFVGWFLESAAASQVQQQRLQDALTGHRVQQVMSSNYATVPADATLEQLSGHHALGNGQTSFVVVHSGIPVGWLPVSRIRQIEASAWPTTTAAQVMTHSEQLKWIQPDEDLWTALKKMERDGVNQMPVVADRQVMGLLRKADVFRYLRALRESGASAS